MTKYPPIIHRVTGAIVPQPASLGVSYADAGKLLKAAGFTAEELRAARDVCDLLHRNTQNWDEEVLDDVARMAHATAFIWSGEEDKKYLDRHQRARNEGSLHLS